MVKSNLNHRQPLLDAALAVILAKGFPAARVDEICAEAGVTKGSFYHHFESKEALAHELVDHYFSSLMGEMSAGKWQEVADPKERLAKFLDHSMGVMRGPMIQQGCLLGSFALDLSETHPDLRERIEERFERLSKVVEGLIRDAAKGQRLAGALKPKVLARQFVAVIQGSVVMAKAYADHDRLAEGVGCYVALLRSQLDL